ncbi:hypothetical protein RE6C_05210 [Rhodopirellula europaea 6C]|uniref:Uncharacterized protein n=3 Tax=Pirellulaceae TaxID=2691357 RepID=M2A408_9BACT|nr:hypothetical protein RE6C_05210 [Rhodopirellula europaea 6C]
MDSVRMPSHIASGFIFNRLRHAVQQRGIDNAGPIRGDLMWLRRDAGRDGVIANCKMDIANWQL